MNSPRRQRKDKVSHSECSRCDGLLLVITFIDNAASIWVLNASEPRHDQKQNQQRNKIGPSRKREQQRVAVGGLKYPSSCDGKEHPSNRPCRSADAHDG